MLLGGRARAAAGPAPLADAFSNRASTTPAASPSAATSHGLPAL